MRLLHIIASMEPSTGGTCQGIRNLNSVLKDRKIETEVVCLDDPKAPYIGSDSFVIHALGPSKSGWQYSSKLLPWLIDNLYRFDIVVVNGLWLYHGYAAMKALKILESRKTTMNEATGNIPKLFVMPHGMLDPYFQKAPDRKLKALRNWIYWNMIEGRNIKRANGLLFTCEIEMHLARQNFGSYKPRRELNVGFGVEDAPAFSYQMSEAFWQKCPGLNLEPYFLFLSRIHSKKGVDLLINAYIECCKGKPGKTAGDNYPKLVIAGPGMESDYGKSLQDIISKYPEMRSSIFFPGMLSGNAKWGALYGCEAFVLPSHQENFGIAVVEALACRKPVLISNQINIWKEIISHGGGMAKEDTLNGTIELFNSWSSLLPEKKISMAQNARISFEKNFSVGPAAARFVDAINKN